MTDKHLEQFVIEETNSDEEAQDLRDGSDYQKFAEEDFVTSWNKVIDHAVASVDDLNPDQLKQVAEILNKLED